jgi:hypothetical protein
MLKLLHLLNILKTHRKRCGFPQKRNIYHLSCEKVNNQYLDISGGLYEYVGLPKAAYGGNLCGNCGRNPYIIRQISPLVFGPDYCQLGEVPPRDTH